MGYLITLTNAFSLWGLSDMGLAAQAWLWGLWPLGVKGSLQATASDELNPYSYKHRKQILLTTWVILEGDSSIAESPDENAAGPVSSQQYCETPRNWLS
mgnify:CR=1 FL=1